jgi:hypothetical protein
MKKKKPTKIKILKSISDAQHSHVSELQHPADVYVLLENKYTHYAHIFFLYLCSVNLFLIK